MSENDPNQRQYPDLSPMWELYVSYLKELLPWEQKTVVGRQVDLRALRADLEDRNG